MPSIVKEKFRKKTWKFSSVCHLLALVCIGYAFYQGYTATRNVSWPCEIDLMRNTAEAQATLDGSLLGDPTYLGEMNWYSPLAHWTAALISSVSGIPPHIVTQRAGAFLNLPVPVFFYLFIALLLDPLIALASLVGMLFIFNNNLPACTSGTYTPILYSSHFAPWLFFLTLFLFFKASKTEKSFLYLLTGLSLGLTFLAHNAPALIIGCIVFAFTIWKIWKLRGKGNRRIISRTILNFLIVTFSAALTALPLLYPMLIHYKMKVLNERGTLYTLDFLRPEKIGEFLSLYNPGWIFLFFLILGVIGIFKKAKKSEEARLMIFSFGIVLLLFIYGYIWQLNNGVFNLPQLLPGFHYLVYIGFFEAILFGFGIVEFISNVSKAVSRLFESKKKTGKEKRTDISKTVPSVLFILTLGIFFFTALPRYVSRQDFAALRHPSCAKADMKWYERLNNWVISNLPPDTVFLNDENTPSEMLMTARKFVVHPITPELSNPFVDYQARLKDRDLMFLALEEGRYDTLLQLFEKYHISYVTSSASEYENHWHNPVFLKDVYHSKECVIYSIDYPVLKKIASQAGLVRNHPYVLLENQNMFSNAVIYGIEKRHFNYFESGVLGKVFDGWQWIAERNFQTDINLLLQRMESETLLITTRRTAMKYINDSRTKPEFTKDYLFCGFTLPRKTIKLQYRNPEKVLIFHKDSGYQKFLSAAGIKIYSFTDPYSILKESSPDNISFIQEACRMTLNCGMLERYALDWDRKIRKGRASREDVISSLLKQAATIDY